MSDLAKRLRIKAGMIEMGERIAWGSDSALMREAADALEMAAPDVQGESVYLYRRLGLHDFVTCNHDRYSELSVKPHLFETKVLYTAPQPEEQQPDVAQLVEALEQIERWDAFPSTDKTWEGSGEPVSYGAAFGSNGERDFMRDVARKALAAHRKQQEGEA